VIVNIMSSENKNPEYTIFIGDSPEEFLVFSDLNEVQQYVVQQYEL